MPEKSEQEVHFIVPQKPGEVMYRADHVLCGKVIVPGEGGHGMRVTDRTADATCPGCKAKL